MLYEFIFEPAPRLRQHRRKVGFGSDSEKLAMSTMGPLCLEQLTQEEALEEVCVGPIAEVALADQAKYRSPRP